jgi:hypothetical protein
MSSVRTVTLNHLDHQRDQRDQSNQRVRHAPEMTNDPRDSSDQSISQGIRRAPVHNRDRIHREPNRDQRGGDLIVMIYHLERDIKPESETTTQTNGHMELKGPQSVPDTRCTQTTHMTHMGETDSWGPRGTTRDLYRYTFS